MKVFWSWQSDSPVAVGKDFVKGALEEATRQLAEELELSESERPVVDHDTQGEAGMVDIVSTIFRKVEAAAVFVADVTTVAKTEQGRSLQNPNTLIELGYAMRALTPERVVLVANKAYPYKPEALPFDIRQRRGALTYTLKKGSTPEEVTKAREALVTGLLEALKPIVTKLREQRTAELPIRRRPQGINRAVWFRDGERLQHRGSLLRGSTVSVDVASTVGIYVRITPGQWDHERPNAQTIKGVPVDVGLQPLGQWSGADHGLNSDGYLIRDAGSETQTGTPLATTVAQWFDETAEVWAFDSKGVVEHQGLTYFPERYALKEWALFLQRTLAMLERRGARGPFLVEIGATWPKGTRWSSKSAGDQVEALQSEAYVEERMASVTEKDQLALLLKAINKVRLAFGVLSAGTLQEVTQSW